MSAHKWNCKICGKEISYELDKSFDACLEHKPLYIAEEEAKREARYEKEFINFKEIDEDGTIVCPYCFKEFSREPWYEYIDGHDEDPQDVECVHCEKTFTAQLRKAYNIKTKRKEKG